MASHFVARTLRRTCLDKHAWKICNQWAAAAADSSRATVAGGFINTPSSMCWQQQKSYSTMMTTTAFKSLATLSFTNKHDSYGNINVVHNCRNFTWKGKVPSPPPTPSQQSNCKNATSPECVDDGILPPQNLGLFARFKMMYKQYWYVLVPVHVVTSTGWLLGFFYLSKR